MPQPKNHKRPNLPYDEQTIAELRELVADCPTWLEAREVLVKRLGSNPDNVTRMNKRHGFWPSSNLGSSSNGARDLPDPGLANVKDSPFEAHVETSTAATLEEVVQLCQVDLKKWEPRGFSVIRRKTGFGWNARFMRRPDEVDPAELLQAFVQHAKEHAPRSFKIEKQSTKAGECLYLLNLQDLHLGKLAWQKETLWPDWDVKIAKEAYRESVADLLAKAPSDRIDTVLLIVGSDLIHCDSPKNETTNGTRLDVDTRWAKLYEEACRLMVETIEPLASRFKVEVMVIMGNHASISEYCVGSYIEAWFHSHPNVRVHNAPSKRKYYDYGSTLFCFIHNAGALTADTALTMMRENQKDVSKFKYFHVLSGDKHTETVKDVKGVRMSIAPALCSPDFWHSENNFVGNVRQSQGMLFHRERGLEATFYSTPLD